MRVLALICIVFFSSFSAKSQYHLRGKIVDTETGKALPFVNIVYTEKGQGLTTDLDGTFKISTDNSITWLNVSFVGYASRRVEVKPESYQKSMLIGLEPTLYSIDEVTVKPGINPAHRIIDSVYQNRNRNNPEKLQSFRYTSYNKMYFTVNVPKAKKIDTNDSLSNPDSLALKLENMKKRMHLMMMESVSQRSFLSPSKVNETVLASKVSGLKDPFLVFLATQFQSFSFYPELVNLAGKYFLNPISKGSASRYLFILEDKMLTEQNDTVFVISFRPLLGKNFEGLKGVINISSNGYAIQSVIAEPNEGLSPLLNAKIQQRYEFIEGRQWFPVELNTDIYYNKLNPSAKDKKSGEKVDLQLVGVGKSYIKDIEMNINLKAKDFSHIELSFDPRATQRDEEFWMQFRVDSLTAQEIITYRVVDSIGRDANLDKKMQLFETLLTGKIPLGFLNFNLNQALKYNQFEGFRVGAGLETNRKVSQWFVVGGNYAYGFYDKEHKYGGFARLVLSKRQQVSLEGNYNRDVREPGVSTFEKPFGIFSSENFRDVNVNRMDYVDQYKAQLSFRMLNNFTVKLVGLKSDFSIASGNLFVNTATDTLKHFRTTEAGIEIKFVWKEKFMETPRGLIPLNTSFPVVWLNYYRGLKAYNSDFSYNKIELKLTHSIPFRTIGKTTFTLTGAVIDGEAPSSLHYFAPGNLDKYYLDAENTFGTMRLYEFIADRYACLFVRHDLGNNFFNTHSDKWKLRFFLAHNMAIGDYTEKSSHLFENYTPNTLRKGFFESGFVSTLLLRSSFSAPGVGIFYRYGPNSSSSWKENVAIKLSLGINF